MEATEQIQVELPDDALKDIARRVHYHDEQDWIPWAWAMLARSGDVPTELDEDDEGYPEHFVTLAALAHLFERFHDKYDGVEEEDDTQIELTGTDRPFLTTIELARYAERHDVTDRKFPETVDGLEREVILDSTPSVRKQLLDALGPNRLFTSLFISMGPATIHQYDDEDGHYEELVEHIGASLEITAFDQYINDVMSTDVTMEKSQVHMWVTA